MYMYNAVFTDSEFTETTLLENFQGLYMHLHDSCTMSCQVKCCKILATDLAQVLPVSYEDVLTRISETVTQGSCQESYP